MGRLILIILSLSILGCSKPDPNPELKDPVYLDLKAQEGITKKNIEDFSKQLEEHRAAMEKVKPQTGQIKYAEKRYWETKNHVDKLKQQYDYWLIRISERTKHAREEYLKAYKEGKPWPNPQEIQEYMAEKRLRQAKQQWDVKSRMNELKAAENSPAPSTGH